MALKLSSPVIEEFPLVRSESVYGDGSGEPSSVLVRQATQGANERRSRVFAEISRVIETQEDFGSTVQLRQRWSMEELKRIEVYLTLAGCNIQDADGTDLFRFRDEKLAMSENDFRVAWAKLPPEVAAEIHEKVLEVNYVWRESGEAN